MPDPFSAAQGADAFLAFFLTLFFLIGTAMAIIAYLLGADE